ncbi:response regulator transcription factor [Streptomyces sp. NPDC002809]|uniref:response regulator transcription factor n=1 Tax=Streptomyces sp. NPDC002809 TaxID=3154433 RepID=UPI00331DA3F0
MTTVLIVDDQPLQRMGYAMLLTNRPDVTVVGEAESGLQAVRMTADLRPDVVLMDVRMPGIDGIEATHRIVASGARSHVIVLTTFDLDEYAYDALRAGASGFLLKDARPEELLAAIHSVSAGDAVISPRMTRRLLTTHLLQKPAAAGAPQPMPYELSAREHDVFIAIAHGMSNSEIAQHLHLTESTVKKHVSNLLAKIGARDRVQAVIAAYDLGLVTPRTQRKDRP